MECDTYSDVWKVSTPPKWMHLRTACTAYSLGHPTISHFYAFCLQYYLSSHGTLIRTDTCSSSAYMRASCHWPGHKRIHNRYPWISIPGIRYTIKEEHERQSGVSKPRPGRPRKLDETDKQRLMDAITNNPKVT